MKHRFMDEQRATHTVKRMCEVLEVSRSGYYAWKARQVSMRQQENEELLERIRAIHAQSRRLYGSPRIRAELHEQGFRCGKNRVARIMKDHALRADVKRRRFRRTTDSGHTYALAANLLLDQNQTEGVWAADMTFVPTSEGWLYVAAVMQVKTRKIIGLCMSERITQELASDALRDAVGRQGRPEGLIHHSDPGQAVCKLCLPGPAEGIRDAGQHEQKRQLLRQCLYGVLLRHAQDRVGPWRAVSYEVGGAA
jgi:hypothetical protein